jgi:hypothetical protein
MSIIKTLDVFCDGEGCGIWVHGDCGKVVSYSKARRDAAKTGWGIRYVDGLQSDLCPDCLAKFVRPDSFVEDVGGSDS